MKNLATRVLFFVALENVQAGETALSKDDIARSSIFYRDNELISKLMATRLADYIKLHSGVNPMITTSCNVWRLDGWNQVPGKKRQKLQQEERAGCFKEIAK